MRALTVMPLLIDTVLVGTSWLFDCGPLGVVGVRGVLGDEARVDMVGFPVQMGSVQHNGWKHVGMTTSESVGHIVQSD